MKEKQAIVRERYQQYQRADKKEKTGIQYDELIAVFRRLKERIDAARQDTSGIAAAEEGDKIIS